jgi:cyclopropane-fatty-acyl-phospholipid synthase
MSLFDRVFSALVRSGPLIVNGPDGTLRKFGRSDPAVKPVAIRIADRATAARIARNPALGAGEAYMDGRLIVEQGDIRDFLDLIGFNIRWDRDNPVRVKLWRPQRIAASLDAWNWKRRSRRNAAHHYDLDRSLYELFLDSDLQYSCAYFNDPSDSLDRAQHEKKAHIAAKLRLSAGQRMLDIGCGWGGLALYLAGEYGVEILGITLSQEQLEVARSRADRAGLAKRVRFELGDYREVSGEFDRIVSVGMFEHVGPPHFRTFFERCRQLLAPDGLMLLHTIARADGPGATDAWLAKYIFPGGYIPALSQIAPALEKSWLWLTDIEVLGPHYEWTLSHWYERATAAKEQIVSLYDERFFRMWQFYLAGGVAAFRHDALVVFQLQLARTRRAWPARRDYMAEEEARLLRRRTGGEAVSRGSVNAAH